MRDGMTRTILVATTNPGKLEELTALLEQVGRGIEWLDLKDFPGISQVVEDGETFADNARKKAIAYAQATGLWTIADDSGLVIDALNGAPGVYSARYAADECSPSNRKTMDTANWKKVLRQLKDVPDEKRTARFVCHLCLASPQEILIEATGTIEGVINHRPVGENGFGYDPIFYIPSIHKTAAQLENHEKNEISHRGTAIRQFKLPLENLLKQ
jgi:XTP/dITP diphosphohydrolase